MHAYTTNMYLYLGIIMYLSYFKLHINISKAQLFSHSFSQNTNVKRSPVDLWGAPEPLLWRPLL